MDREDFICFFFQFGLLFYILFICIFILDEVKNSNDVCCNSSNSISCYCSNDFNNK